MNEDDTFNKLKKATFRDVLSRMTNQTDEEKRSGRWVLILESMGWTEKEYVDTIIATTEDIKEFGALG